jgi:ssDNA-binding Zn-finger/Zn-ribbon topoisomerase 1
VTILDVEMTDYHPKCPNPNCDRYMKLRQSKFSKYGPSAFYGCQGYPTCKTTWGCYGDGRTKGEPKVR